MIPVKLNLTNRWAQFRCSPETQVALKTEFRYKIPGAEFSEAFRCGSWDGFRCLMQRGRVPAGLFLALRERLAEKYAFDVRDLRVAPEFRPVKDDGSRPYQREAVQAMRESSKTGCIVLAATGSGKTRLAAEFCRQLDGLACFVVDELTLLEQSRREMEEIVGEKIGVVGRSEFQPRRVTVATIQTLHRHRESPDFRSWFSGLDVVILDEYHVAINRRNVDIIQTIAPKSVYGLTATLELGKPHVFMPAVALAGPVGYEYPIARGIEEEYLSPVVVVRAWFDSRMSSPSPSYWSEESCGRRTLVRGGTPAADYRHHVVRNRRRNDLISALVKEAVRRGHRVMLLAERVSHLQILSRRLVDIPHKTLWGQISSEDRFSAMKAMDAGKLPLIIANRVFGKGVNVRSVSLIVDATGMPGANAAVQRLGRGSRKSAGKAGLIYVDVADRGKGLGASLSRAKALRGFPTLEQDSAEVLATIPKAEEMLKLKKALKLKTSNSRKENHERRKD